MENSMGGRERSAIEIRDGGRNEDFACDIDARCCRVLAVADGAGGVGSGAFAADAVIQEAEALSRGDNESPEQALLAAERIMFGVGGQSTGVIVRILNGSLQGASVGDSCCWWLVEGGFVDLTANQDLKPLLGDGGMPYRFGPYPCAGRLLLATDGLFNYADHQLILQTAAEPNLAWAAKQLAELPRLSNGEWPDDIAIVLADIDLV